VIFTTKPTRARRSWCRVGAGADVTAMGVFSDVLKLLHYLPR
jgi:homoserine dehydrogenase